VTREGPYWVGSVRGLRGGATETRRLGNLEAAVRDLIAGLLDIDEATIELRLNYEPALEREGAKMVKQAIEARAQLRAAQEVYDSVMRQAASELRSESVSLRDSASLLGVSFQRVQQLVN
jgi:hypothetical protein